LSDLAHEYEVHPVYVVSLRRCRPRAHS
jgi:hypothetical protein